MLPSVAKCCQGKVIEPAKIRPKPTACQACHAQMQIWLPCQQSHHDRYLALHTCLQAPAPTHLSGLPTVEMRWRILGPWVFSDWGRQLRASRRNYKVVVLCLAVDAVQRKGLFLCRAMSAQEISLQKVSFQRFPKVSV